MKLVLALLAVLAINAGIMPGRVATTLGASESAPLHSGVAASELAPLKGGEGEDEVAPPHGDQDGAYGRYGEVWRVHTQRKEIALTFDDGPYPFYTPVLLHVLERSHVPATFFIVGRSAQEFPELVTRIVQSGDEIGNHTFNHLTLTQLPDDQIASQIAMDGTMLARYTHKPISLFRPPHGRFNRHVVTIAHELGYHTIFWSDAANDVKDIPPDIITERVMNEASPGGIILLHSGQYRTIEALPDIIDGLRAQGYTFVTVSQLLEDGEQT